MRFLLILAVTLISPIAFAFDEADEKALAEVQALLQNPDILRGPAGNPHEKAALSEIDKLTKKDPAVQKEINQLSSEIFTDLVKKNGANAESLGAALLEAQQDPAKFLQSLSPEQQRKIRELASEIDEKKKK